MSIAIEADQYAFQAYQSGILSSGCGTNLDYGILAVGYVFPRLRSLSTLMPMVFAQHPFGNYAPQSSAIQGILKGMYDSMAADLEKDNAEEADREKAFHELMATKKAERETLETTLEKQSHDEAHKSKALSDAKTNRDDTDAQMCTDECGTDCPASFW